ncbi:protein NINJA homolog 1 isoform X1 [Typha latifolia]|uniref:protein NINJA homolog 1 isoform X1 n=1 Tax=Typha latifolia TaxID=4733 RepID=UPI003C2EA64F
MEDENGLELSLGLSFGGSSTKSKARDVTPDRKMDEGSSSRGGASDVPFAKFFQTNFENQDHDGKQKSDAIPQARGNFWTDQKSTAPMAGGSSDAQSSQSQVPRYQELWMSTNKANDSEEERSSLNKRKSPYEDTQKKNQRVVHHIEGQGRGPASVTLMKNAHVSITTEEGSTGENEDVAESEAEGSNSWMVSQHEDSSKRSDAHKTTDKHAPSDTTGICFQGQKHPNFLGSESNPGKVTYGIPVSFQALNVANLPYPVPGKVPSASSTPNSVGFASPCVMQLMPLAASEQPIVQGKNANNVQLAFGYSSIQLPTLETNPSWAFGSQAQLASSSVMKDQSDGAPNPQHVEDDRRKSHGAGSIQTPHISSPALVFDRKSPELVEGNGKLAGQVGKASSSQAEDRNKDNKLVFKQKETANEPVAESYPHLGSAIRPGVASNLKFGGCGSYPDLPWVSTTGSGPNGKTISGVTYKYSRHEIKIVCACHGSHMSPEEFVQHASADTPIPENNTNIGSFPVGNPATSAQN